MYFGYLFYKVSKNKMFVDGICFFLDRELMSNESSGSPIDLEEIHESNKKELVVETSTQPEVEQPVKEINITQTPSLRRSNVIRLPPKFNCFDITIERDVLIGYRTLAGMYEPSNYNEVITDPNDAQ